MASEKVRVRIQQAEADDVLAASLVGSEKKKSSGQSVVQVKVSIENVINTLTGKIPPNVVEEAHTHG